MVDIFTLEKANPKSYMVTPPSNNQQSQSTSIQKTKEAETYTPTTHFVSTHSIKLSSQVEAFKVPEGRIIGVEDKANKFSYQVKPGYEIPQENLEQYRREVSAAPIVARQIQQGMQQRIQQDERSQEIRGIIQSVDLANEQSKQGNYLVGDVKIIHSDKYYTVLNKDIFPVYNPSETKKQDLYSQGIMSSTFKKLDILQKKPRLLDTPEKFKHEKDIANIWVSNRIQRARAESGFPTMTEIFEKKFGNSPITSFERGVENMLVNKPVDVGLTVTAGIVTGGIGTSISGIGAGASTGIKIIGIGLTGLYAGGVAANVASSENKVETLGGEAVNLAAFIGGAKLGEFGAIKAPIKEPAVIDIAERTGREVIDNTAVSKSEFQVRVERGKESILLKGEGAGYSMKINDNTLAIERYTLKSPGNKIAPIESITVNKISPSGDIDLGTSRTYLLKEGKYKLVEDMKLVLNRVDITEPGKIPEISRVGYLGKNIAGETIISKEFEAIHPDGFRQEGYISRGLAVEQNNLFTKLDKRATNFVKQDRFKYDFNVGEDVLIKNVIKKQLSLNPEFDKNGICIGNCDILSKAIGEDLNKLGIRGKVVDVNKGLGHTGGHKALLLENSKIVDSQLWQFEKKFTPINQRKMLFTEGEYGKKGYTIIKEKPKPEDYDLNKIFGKKNTISNNVKEQISISEEKTSTSNVIHMDKLRLGKLSKIISISLEKPKVKSIKSISFGLASISLLSLNSALGTIQSPKLIQTPKLIPDIVQTPKLIPDIVQTPKLIPDIVQTSKLIPDIIQTPRITPPILPFIPGLQGFSLGFGKRSSAIRKPRIKTKYTASIEALAFNIHGKRNRIATISGLGLRPL